MTAQRQSDSTPASAPSRPGAAGDTGQSLTSRRESRQPDQVLPAMQVLMLLCELQRVDHRALHLIYWRGLTQAQVAAELKLPEQAVRQCVARGMRELATLLTAGAPDGAVRG